MSTAQSLPKGGTSRFNLSTQSLDMVISTFQVQDRGTQQASILGLWGANGVGSAPGDSSFGYSTGLTATSAGVGEFGTYAKSFPFGLTVGWPKTFVFFCFIFMVMIIFLWCSTCNYFM